MVLWNSLDEWIKQSIYVSCSLKEEKISSWKVQEARKESEALTDVNGDCFLFLFFFFFPE